MLQTGVDMVVIDDYNYERDPKGILGLEVLKRIKHKCPFTEVVILTSSADISLAVEAMQTGAHDYIFNKRGAWNRLQSDIKKLFAAPINYLFEYGVVTFILIYSAVFIALAITAYLASGAGN
jgi:DNA-binding NtrC family response regulator